MSSLTSNLISMFIKDFVIQCNKNPNFISIFAPQKNNIFNLK